MGDVRGERPPVRLRVAREDGDRLPPRRPAARVVLEAGARAGPRGARPGPTRPGWRRLGAQHRLDGEARRGGARHGMDAHVRRALLHRRPCAVVLRRKDRMAIPPDLRLPPLARRPVGLVAGAPPRRGGRRRGRAVVPAQAYRQGTARGDALLRGHALPGARVLRLLPDALLVRRRPLPVPGEHRAGHPARSPRDPGRRPAARSRLRGCRRASRDAGRLHLAPGRHLREPGNPLARHRRQESRRRPRAQ